MEGVPTAVSPDGTEGVLGALTGAGARLGEGAEEGEMGSREGARVESVN